MRRATVVYGISAALMLGGCQTVQAPSIRTIADVATARNPEAAVRGMVKGRASAYTRDPRVLVADLRKVKQDYERLEAFLTGKVNGSWGRKEAKLPGRTQYVKYTQNYRSRAVVDFDAGRITVETVDDKDPRASLKSAIVTTLLTPDDPRAVDLFSDKPITLTSSQTPYLLGLVQDHEGKAVGSPAQAERFADHLLQTQAQARRVEAQEGVKSALAVVFLMVPNFASKQAEKYRDIVERFAGRYKLSPSLVYAIIRTESNFNPFAVSSAPAYGMMQLVPSSGGREAFRHAKGRDEMPTRDYLFDPENNIELGTAYLNVLFERELDPVANPVSREYLVISAYNTGPSNALRAFSKDRLAALNRINSLEPPGVYERLRAHLPYEETRHYLAKVVNFRRQFLSFGN
jgi:membrane-bound lytic murein transglycosylase C